MRAGDPLILMAYGLGTQATASFIMRMREEW